MERFSKVTLNIQNLSLVVAMHHTVKALRPGPFIDSLCKKPAMNLDELRQRATKHMQLDEFREYSEGCMPRLEDIRGMRRKGRDQADLTSVRETSIRRVVALDLEDTSL